MSPSVHLSWHHHTAQGVVVYSATLLKMTMLQTLTASMLWNMHAYTWGTPGKNRTMEMGVSYMNSYSAHTIYSTVLLWNKWEILRAVGTTMASDNPLLKIGPKGRKPEEFFQKGGKNPVKVGIKATINKEVKVSMRKMWKYLTTCKELKYP